MEFITRLKGVLLTCIQEEVRGEQGEGAASLSARVRRSSAPGSADEVPEYLLSELTF